MILWLISRVAGSAVLNQELKYTQLLLSGESCPKVLALVHWKSYYFFPVISPWKPNSEFIFYHSTTPGIAGASRNFLHVCDCWFWLWLGFAAKIYSHCTSELCFCFSNLGVSSLDSFTYSESKVGDGFSQNADSLSGIVSGPLFQNM